MRVNDIMTPCPYNIRAASSIKEALESMALWGVRHLPVVDEGLLIGILTERDAQLSQMVCDAAGHCPDVGTICSREPFLVLATDDVGQMAQQMYERRVDCAIIVDDEEAVVGIFTAADACRLINLVLKEHFA